MRKKKFFESEENDRVARLSVGVGELGPAWAGGAGTNSNASSAPTSRTGSLRGRRKGREELRAPLGGGGLVGSKRREGSTDSIDSAASSIATVSGRAPSGAAIAMLLDPNGPPAGVHAPDRGAKNTRLGHQRTWSLGNAAAAAASLASPSPSSNNANANANANPNAHLSPHAPARSLAIPMPMPMPMPMRPHTLRRTTSCGEPGLPGESDSEVSNGVNVGDVTDRTEGPTKDRLMQAQVPSSAISATSSSPRSPSAATTSSLRMAISAAFAQAGRSRSRGIKPHEGAAVSFSSDQADQAELEEQEEEGQEEEDLRPYRDGTPALILPGGGRLPDAARDLLERMLAFEPARRPGAGEVRRALEGLEI